MASESETRSEAARESGGGRLGAIGAYRLLSKIGEGGFGEVYEAEQSEPVRRRVALKIIKAGMDSASVVARFEGERQALAVMDHPCIAKVFDGGVTPPEMGSRPFFVMELVRGEEITAFCDRERLTIRQRCELMIRVCEAVQHAHNKGVIHRDLKPSNILVSYDAEGHATPKVIDFGVAKALNQRLTERTIFTERGQLIGTPEYMSPEQAEMSGLDIDTRSDVYSLGVLLYELLTGSLPFDAETLRAAGFAEVQRIIREVEPPRPSTRLSAALSGESAEAASRMVELRHTDARSLTGVLRRDLDWVAMRSLEKDRERRYDTANALGMELRRYLQDVPVLAGPPSLGRKLRRLTHRYARSRRFAVAASLVGGAVLLGIGIAARGPAAQAARRIQLALVGYEETRDDDAQRVVLAEVLRGLRDSEAASGHAVVLDPRNGDLRAIVDATRKSDGDSPSDWSRVDESGFDVASDLSGFAATGWFEPGSALKPAVWCVLTQADSRVVFGDRDAGSRRTDYGRLIREVTARTTTDWGQVLSTGSNAALTEVADAMPHETLREGLVRFGIGQPPGESLEQLGVGVITSEDRWSAHTQTSVAMGFDVGVSLLQLARAYVPICRTDQGAGQLVPVRVRRPSARSLDRVVAQRATPEWIVELARAQLESAASRTQESLERLGDPGADLAILGYSGTIQENSGPRSAQGADRYSAVYIGAAPADSPRFVVAVLIRDVHADLVRERRHYGSQVAAPVVQRILRRLLEADE